METIDEILTHKGLTGSIDFSGDENIFFGKIEGIENPVNFEGKTINELITAFEQAVENYLGYSQDIITEPIVATL